MPTTSAGLGLILLAAGLCTAQVRVVAQTGPDIVWAGNNHTNMVNAVVFSTDGIMVASGGSDGMIRVKRAADGNPVLTLTNQGSGVLQLAFSGNESLVSWDLANTLKVWRLSDATVVRSQLISGVWGGTALSESGELLAVAGYDLNTAVLRVFRVADGSLVQSFAGDFPQPSISADNQKLAASPSLAERYEIPLWRLDSGTLERTFTNVEGGFSAGTAPFFSYDGRILAVPPVPYGVTECWSVDDGAYLGAIFDHHDSPLGNKIAKLLGFTPDGRILISVNNFDVFRFWLTSRLSPQRRLETSLAMYDQEPVPIKAMTVSPRGGMYAYGREDGKVVVARIPTFITEATRQGSQFILRWAGGGGSYQLQQRANLSSGDWENSGAPTTATGFTNNAAGGTMFYRVQSVPN